MNAMHIVSLCQLIAIYSLATTVCIKKLHLKMQSYTTKRSSLQPCFRNLRLKIPFRCFFYKNFSARRKFSGGIKFRGYLSAPSAPPCHDATGCCYYWLYLWMCYCHCRQLQHASSSQIDTSRRSSMSDIIIEDIDDNFVELNDKVDNTCTCVKWSSACY